MNPSSGLGRIFLIINSAIRDQIWLIKSLLRDKALGSIMVVIWTVTFGGNVQNPVLSFFYVLLGMSAFQIGQSGFIMTFGTLICAPLYGWLLDRRSAYLALLMSISLCGLGCLIKGMGASVSTVFISSAVMGIGGTTFETMALAMLCRHVPSRYRSLLISGFLLQVRILGMLGRAFYPLWNLFIEDAAQVQDPMTRYRIAIAMCTAPCVIGFAGLAMLHSRFHALEAASAASHSPESTCDSCSAAGSDDPLASAADGGGAGDKHREEDKDSDSTSRTQETRRAPEEGFRGGVHAWSQAILLLGMVVNSMTSTSLMVLWPLFLQRHMGWTDSEYSLVLLCASIMSGIALACYPSMEALLGAGPIRIFAAACAGLAATVSFLIQSPDSGLVVAHCLLGLAVVFSCALLDPGLQAAVSLRVFGKWHGRIFGGMAALTGIGAVLANLISTALFDSSYESLGVGGGGALPMIVMGILQGFSAAALFFGHTVLDRGLGAGADMEMSRSMLSTTASGDDIDDDATSGPADTGPAGRQPRPAAGGAAPAAGQTDLSPT